MQNQALAYISSDTVRVNYDMVFFLLQRLMFQPGALATKVVCLTQVVNADELQDDEAYEDIVEDMRIEGGKFGNDLGYQLVDILIFLFFSRFFLPIFLHVY